MDKKQSKKKPTVEDLMKLIDKLESRLVSVERNHQCCHAQYICPYPHYIQTPCHYHNGTPCYNNPCYWA